MIPFRIGRRELGLEVLGRGARTGRLLEGGRYRVGPSAKLPADLAFSAEEEADLSAFYSAGWRFPYGAEWNLGRVGKRSTGLLVRRSTGGLAILRDHLVIQFQPDLSGRELERRLKKYQRVWKLGFGDNLYEVKLPPPTEELELELLRELERLKRDGGSGPVQEISLLERLQPQARLEYSVADESARQWHWDNILLREAWQSGRTQGAGIRVAVIDLGFDPCDPQLVDGVKLTACFKEDGTLIRTGPMPRRFHGTFCAGLVGARPDGVHGALPACELLLVALPESSVASQVLLARALHFCIDPSQFDPTLRPSDGADVVSCSLGITEADWPLSDALRLAINYASSRRRGEGSLGTPVVWAVFNADKEIHPSSVNACRPLLSVAQSDQWNMRRDSAYGMGLDLIAPGHEVLGIVSYASGYRVIARDSGASYAAPCTAGVAALVLAVNRDLNYEQVADILTQSCDPDETPKKWRREQGWGRLNALRAVEMALELRAGGRRFSDTHQLSSLDIHGSSSLLYPDERIRRRGGLSETD